MFRESSNCVKNLVFILGSSLFLSHHICQLLEAFLQSPPLTVSVTLLSRPGPAEAVLRDFEGTSTRQLFGSFYWLHHSSALPVSAPTVVREVQAGGHHTPIRTAKIEAVTIPNAGEDGETPDAGGIVKWHRLFGSQSDRFLK